MKTGPSGTTFRQLKLVQAGRRSCRNQFDLLVNEEMLVTVVDGCLDSVIKKPVEVDLNIKFKFDLARD